MPYFAFISGLTKRQPMVVSSIFARARERAVGLAHHERRARHALDAAGDASSSASPARIARAAMPTASRPEPHRRLTVRAGHLDRQARRAAPPCARRCGCPRPPGWRSRRYTSSTAAQSTPGLRSSAPRAESRRDRRGDAGERAAVAAEGSANRVADEGLAHGRTRKNGHSDCTAPSRRQRHSARAYRSCVTCVTFGTGVRFTAAAWTPTRASSRRAPDTDAAKRRRLGLAVALPECAGRSSSQKP